MCAVSASRVYDVISYNGDKISPSSVIRRFHLGTQEYERLALFEYLQHGCVIRERDENPTKNGRLRG